MAYVLFVVIEARAATPNKNVFPPISDCAADSSGTKMNNFYFFLKSSCAHTVDVELSMESLHHLKLRFFNLILK